MFSLLIAVICIGWVAAAAIGTQAYFRGEQTKPIHERNLKSSTFEQLAETLTGAKINHAERVLVYAMDSYRSNNLSR